MAKSNIELEIKTKYDGEGFKKADQAVKEFSKGAKTATDSVSKITHALGTLDGKAGKIAGSIGGIFQSFAHGGVMGLAIAGITTAFSLMMDKIKEAGEASKRAAQELGDNFISSLNKIEQRWHDFKKNIAEGLSENMSSIDRKTAETNSANTASAYSIRTKALGEDGVEKLTSQREANKIARESAMAEADANVKKIEEQRAANARLISQSTRNMSALERQHLRYKNGMLGEISREIDAAEKSYANTGYTNLGAKKLVRDLKARRNHLDDIAEGRFKPYGRDAVEGDFTDEIEKQAFNHAAGYVQKKKQYEDDFNTLLTNDTQFSDKLAVAKAKKKDLQAQQSFADATELKQIEDAKKKQKEKELKDAEDFNARRLQDLEAQRKAEMEIAEEAAKIQEENRKRSDEANEQAKIAKEQKEIEKKHKDSIKEIDKKIEKAKRQQAKDAEVEAFFRNGGTVGGWFKPGHGDRDAAQAEKDMAKQQRNIDNKIADYQRKYQDKDGEWYGWVGDDVKEQFDQMLDVANALDPVVKMLRQNEIDKLNARKEQMQQDMHDDIRSIAEALKNGGVAI